MSPQCTRQMSWLFSTFATSHASVSQETIRNACDGETFTLGFIILCVPRTIDNGVFCVILCRLYMYKVHTSATMCPVPVRLDNIAECTIYGTLPAAYFFSACVARDAHAHCTRMCWRSQLLLIFPARSLNFNSTQPHFHGLCVHAVYVP